jgi:hypothetical protein
LTFSRNESARSCEMDKLTWKEKSLHMKRINQHKKRNSLFI